MAARTTTIDDLPNDMLHEILGRVLAGEPDDLIVFTAHPPEGAHLALRSVCRRWRDIADWARLSTSLVCVHPSELDDVNAVRARHPAAFKRVAMGCPDGHSTSSSRAVASMIGGSADLRRALSVLQLFSCCVPSLAPAVTPIASCTALTKLCFVWSGHEREHVVPANMLAPLSALRMLDWLTYAQVAEEGQALPVSALLAPLPALPDAPRLTCLSLAMTGNFVPVGSDAALGRLRRLELDHRTPVQELVDAEDPFLLRAGVDAGTWQPSRLTGLREVSVKLGPVGDALAPVQPSMNGSPAGSEWAPLAGQVTSLSVRVESEGYARPLTGIVAGLGALTALRRLSVQAADMPPGLLELVSTDRLRAPLLTILNSNCVTFTYGVSRFPNLVSVWLGSILGEPPLDLRSLVARSSLKSVLLANRFSSIPVAINLAELFVGGSGWPVLDHLEFHNMVLEWDTTGLAGAPTAAEFAERARQLLPALVNVTIREPRGEGAQPDPERTEFVEACSQHVVPALKGFDTFGN